MLKPRKDTYVNADFLDQDADPDHATQGSFKPQMVRTFGARCSQYGRVAPH